MSAPSASLKSDPQIYGANTNSFYVKFGDVIEVVINNLSNSLHPWHLHGHQFQVVARGDNQGTYNPSTADPLPMKRDVAGVRPGGYVVFRFKADNPGIQLSKSCHCYLPVDWF